MKTIYLVRHGESEENIGRAIVGAPSPLSEKGREQASAIARRATKLPIDVVISSTMTRAQQTAAFIVESTGLPLELSDLFVERAMPSSGLGKSTLDDDIIKMEEHLVEKLLHHEYRHSDEENFQDLKVRARNALTFLEGRVERNILVVSHGAFLKILLGEVLFGAQFSGQEAVALMKKMKTMNTGLTVLNFDPEHKYGPWRIMVYNDHAHLG